MNELMLIRTLDKADWCTPFVVRRDGRAVIDGQVEVVAQFDDEEELYRKAGDCVFGTRHWIGEHGKPCQACGAEQIWVLPVEREVKE